jgi:NADP-reducing hydrogenase subunit HndB
MGRCNEEPTVEVALPNQESIIFGNVDKAKVDEILEKYGK